MTRAILFLAIPAIWLAIADVLCWCTGIAPLVPLSAVVAKVERVVG